VQEPIAVRGSPVFTDRAAAGTALARALQRRSLQLPLIVLALPRGGVPVGYEVARALHAPLDVMLVRKIPLPGEPELAIGAIASGNVVVRDARLAREIPDFEEMFDQGIERELRELIRREEAYRSDLAPLNLEGKTVILIDDGLATGSTMLAAIRAARQMGAARIIVAVPVASQEAVALTAAEADEVVTLKIPPALFSIGAWYEDFEQLEDAEVIRLLRLARRVHSDSTARSRRREAG
jgi:putative phosphoribosyl transferase